MESQDRQYSIDFLKIVATILIVFHHYQQIFIEQTGTWYGKVLFYNGSFYFGYVVEFFFIVSGFFMYRYIQRIQEGLTFKNFILKRTSRLIPLMAVAAVVYEIFLAMYHHIAQVSWFDINTTFWGTIISAMGIQEGWSFYNPSVNNPTWYISVLILCYIVFYLLTWLSKRFGFNEKYLYIFIIFLGTGIITYEIKLPFLSHDAARGYYAFFFGVILAMLLKDRITSLRESLISLGVIAIITFFLVKKYSFMNDGVNYIMTFIYYPALIVIFKSKLFIKLFSSKVFGFVGKISYDVYIWHNPFFIVLYLANRYINFNLGTTEAMIIYTIFSYFIGTISYFILEKPLNRFFVKKLNIESCE